MSRYRSCRKAFEEVYRIVKAFMSVRFLRNLIILAGRLTVFSCGAVAVLKILNFFAIANFAGKGVVLTVMFVTFSPLGETYSGKFK